MKKKSILSFLLLSSLLFTACGDSEDSPSSGDKGKIMVDLKSDVSYPTSKGGMNRALDLTPYQDVKNYTVVLMDADGTVIQSKLYGDMELKQEVDPGSYKVRAFYGENVDAAYDKLYVEGSQEFTVEEGGTKNISFVCTPANSKIKVQYSEDFFTYYSDCTVGFKTQYLPSPFEMKKEDSDKDLYMKAATAGEQLTITFDLKDKDGVSITPKDFGAQTTQIKPRDFLTITIKPKLIEIEGGKISGITVTVDTGVTVENIDVTLPGDYLPGENTEINN